MDTRKRSRSLGDYTSERLILHEIEGVRTEQKHQHEQVMARLHDIEIILEHKIAQQFPVESTGSASLARKLAIGGVNALAGRVLSAGITRNHLPQSGR